MKWNINQAVDQPEKVAIVTGANTGLGYETAKSLAELKFHVVLACRSQKKAEEAMESIRNSLPDAKLDFIALDLGSLDSVKEFSQTFIGQYSRLDLLINNAGLMMPPYFKTEDGFESQLGINFLGHFSLTSQLFETLEKTKNSRIVSLSSIAHNWAPINFDDINFERKYDKKKAYGQSKLACLSFAYELQRRLENNDHQTISVASHPGISNTELSRYFPGFIKPVMSLLFQSAYQGAQPTLYASLGLDIQGGDYCGPGGWREMGGVPVKVGSSRMSKDKQVAAKLWAETERLTGNNFLSEVEE